MEGYSDERHVQIIKFQNQASLLKDPIHINMSYNWQFIKKNQIAIFPQLKKKYYYKYIKSSSKNQPHPNCSPTWIPTAQKDTSQQTFQHISESILKIRCPRGERSTASFKRDGPPLLQSRGFKLAVQQNKHYNWY